MSVVKMTHLRLVGLSAQENKIVDRLSASGVFEVRKPDELTQKLRRVDGSFYRELMLKKSRVSFALDFIKARYTALSDHNKKNKKTGRELYPIDKLDLSSARMLITHADFEDVRAKEYDLLGVCDSLQKLSFDIVDLKTEQAELRRAAEEYAKFSASPVKMSMRERAGDVKLSIYSGGKPTDGELSALGCAFDYREDGKTYTVACRADKLAELDRLMSSNGFERCPFTDDTDARTAAAERAARADEAERAVLELSAKAVKTYAKHYGELRILYDVIGLEIERAEADAQYLKTDSTFLLEGWLPEECAARTVEEIRSECPSVFVQMLAPEERDAPPTLVRSAKIVAPYEQITNMYSPPKYRELDPNPIMSLFFFVFFGLMIGDAAYGAILAAVGFALGLSKRFDKGVKDLLLLVAMGGVSAVVWGALFGSYFAIDFGGTDVALWFNPLEDPMTLLILSIAMGVAQLAVGYVIKFVKLCMDKKPLSALFDAGSILLLFAALICLASTMLIENAPKGLTVAAIVLAAVGLALIVVFGGRKNKNVFGKVFGGLKGVYGLVNLLSDILSYCRIFGLGLATCAIGLAFNTLGEIIFGIPGIGYPVGVLILIPLHVFNLALCILGAYVHNARLQFLEFYGKFYDGGGRLFSPLGSKTKHIRFG